MVIIINKKYKKMQKANLIIGCTGLGLGVVGTTIGTIGLVKECKSTKVMKEELDVVQQHINALERACKKTCKEVAVMQSALINHNMIE